MMRQSRKALGLRRDPRCTIHSATSDQDRSQSDFKVYGQAQEIHDLDMRRRYREALFDKLGWKLEEPGFHLFAVDVVSVAFVEFKDEKMPHRVWDAG